MKEVFKIASINGIGNLRFMDGDFSSYNDAVKAIEQLPAGEYQIQKIFVKD